MCKPSDQDLIERILERDAQTRARALETLFERYGDMIRRHATRIVQDSAAAQDVTQEAFLRVWTRAEQWDGSGSFKAWLYRIATNLALNHLRSVRRKREQPLVIADEWDDDEEESPVPAWMVDDAALDPQAAIELVEQHQRCQRLIDRLPEEKREVFHLVHEMEMSLRDAADELDIPEGTVKSRLYYAKKRLAHEWQAPDNKWEESQ
jgi:RNA polymerase sigma-70 factor (ECF subfamily)